MKKIVISIPVNGDPPKIEAFGFQGRDCLIQTLDFERAFGGADEKTRNKKPEYREAVERTVKN